MDISLRWLGLLSMLTIVITAAIPLTKQPLDWQDSVSHTWVGSRRTLLLMASIFSLAGTGLCASLAFGVVPHFHLPTLLYAVIFLAWVSFMAVAWIPMEYRPGEHSYAHGHFLGGAVLATSAILAMGLIAWRGVEVPTVPHVSCIVAFVLACLWPLPFTRPFKRFFLVIETLVALSFAVTVVLLLTT